MSNSSNRYGSIIEKVFYNHFSPGICSFEFTRTELEVAAATLSIKLPKNIGDVVYSSRYRSGLPGPIMDTAPKGMEWIIMGAGRSKYQFRLVTSNPIIPNNNLVTIKVPDSTPEIISAYAQSDEQALLAKVRYNRLVDVFLGITSFSLQNHLRTTVKDMGQIEIDEVYVGLDKYGRQYVIPVQAKGGKDKHGIVQTLQDIAWCQDKYPSLICRPVSAQFMDNNKIALFSLGIENGDIKLIEERHYQLTSSKEISIDDLFNYQSRAPA